MKFCFWGSIAKGLIGEPIGGGEQQLSLIAKYLNKLGQEVVIIDFDFENDVIIDGIKIISLSSRYSNQIKKYFWFYKLLKKEAADVYYARIRSSIHLIPLIVSKITHSLFIYHLASDLDSLNFNERWKGFYSKTSSFLKSLSHIIHSEMIFPIILKRANHIVTQNKEQFVNLEKKGIINKSIVNNLFEILPKNQYLNLKSIPKEFYIYIGSLDLRKGVKELESLINACDKLKFLIIGKARDKHAKAFVKRIKLNSNVIYLSHQPHNIILDYIGKSKGLINTSIFEGFSNAFIEAWSEGVPVFSLYSNPSGVILEYNLGKYYNGIMKNMIYDLGVNSHKFNKETIINYVKTKHNPYTNTKIIIETIYSL